MALGMAIKSGPGRILPRWPRQMSSPRYGLRIDSGIQENSPTSDILSDVHSQHMALITSAQTLHGPGVERTLQ